MMNTLDVIADILQNNTDIKSMTFCKYPKQTLIQEDGTLNDYDKNFIDSALAIRKKFKLPFWDSLMLTFFDKENVSKNLLSRALMHNENKEKILTSNISEIINILSSNPQENLSLNSEVHFKSGAVNHLFLLDFHLYPSVNNLNIISDILKIMKLHGYILDSGESYHFISRTFFAFDPMINLLAKSLLFSPIVDRAWVAHQLLERSCSIRVGRKHGVIPEVIMEL